MKRSPRKVRIKGLLKSVPYWVPTKRWLYDGGIRTSQVGSLAWKGAPSGSVRSVADFIKLLKPAWLLDSVIAKYTDKIIVIKYQLYG